MDMRVDSKHRNVGFLALSGADAARLRRLLPLIARSGHWRVSCILGPGFLEAMVRKAESHRTEDVLMLFRYTENSSFPYSAFPDCVLKGFVARAIRLYEQEPGEAWVVRAAVGQAG